MPYLVKIRRKRKRKMSSKKKNKNKAKADIKEPKRKFLLIFVCIFVAIVIVFASVLAIVSAVKRSRAVAYFKNVTMDMKVVSFFAVSYKSDFLKTFAASGAEDSPGFFNSEYKDGKTYGEFLREGTESYIKKILAANYVFDRYSSLTKSDRNVINQAVEDTLTYKAGGNENTFNKDTEHFGFDYSAYKTAVEMIYKAQCALVAVCGTNGDNLKENSSLLEGYITEEEFLSNYSHVKLLFIRTEDTFVLDGDGNRKKNSDGTYQIRALTDDEKAARQALISEIRGYIAAIGTSEAQMGPTMFDNYLLNNDEGDSDMHANGYYFAEGAEFTGEFRKIYGNILDKTYSMGIGDFGETAVDFGVCFIYKYAVDTSDIDRSSLEVCFKDFYTNLSPIFYDKLLTELSGEVTLKDSFNELNLIVLEHNYVYWPKFG